MKAGLMLSAAFWGLIALLASGCSGLELGGKLGVYRVDERQESQAMRRELSARPLKCWFVNCPNEEVQGS